MGYMIGMPCMKLNNAGKSSAKCGSFGAVAAEALEERQGKDPDIDHERTTENLYTGFRTAAELQEYSRQHVAELTEKQRAEGKRGIRGDAVVMCATIIKPPAAFMETLSRGDQIRFLNDAKEKLEEVVGKDNVKSTVMHFDEQGGHLHAFWEPMTDDGRLCAKDKMNLKFFKRLNHEMPQHMRSRGWDVDDCKAYDEQAEKDLAAEQEKSAKRKKSGKTSVQFKAEAERQKNELCEQIDELQAEASKLKDEVNEAKLEVSAARQQARLASDAADLAEKRKKDAEQRLSELTKPIETLEAYHKTADVADGFMTAVEASKTAVEGLQRLPELVPLWSRKKASADVQEVSNGLRKLLDRVKELVERLFGFEELTKMPKEERKTIRLDERIKQFEARRSAKPQDRSERDRGRE